MNLAAVPTGWKVYALTCLWLGIAIGVVNESSFAAFILWAAGASFGWLIAPGVRDRGWYVGTRYLRYIAAAGLVAFALMLAFMAMEDTEHRGNQIAVALVSAITAAFLWNHRAVFRFWQWTEDVFHAPISIGGKTKATAPDPTPTRYRCPQCKKPSAFRQADRSFRCAACGHRFSE